MKNSGPSFSDGDANQRLDALLHRYRELHPDPEASANFMPQLWAKIERRKSSSLFSHAARYLVTAALAATAILSVMLLTDRQGSFAAPGVYIEALVTDGESALDLLNPESMTEMELQ